MAPAEALETAALRPAALLLGMITPWTPTASAVLKIEPKLCESSTPSRMTIKGSSPFDCAISKISSTST